MAFLLVALAIFLAAVENATAIGTESDMPSAPLLTNKRSEDGNVQCTIVVENKTPYRFRNPKVNQWIPNTVVDKAVAIPPGGKDTVVTRTLKDETGATHARGTLSWKIQGFKRRFVLLYAVPVMTRYTDVHEGWWITHWLAVGMTRRNKTAAKWFWTHHMLHSQTTEDLNFVRKAFPYLNNGHTDPVIFSNGGFKITATLNRVSNSEAKITVSVEYTAA